MDDDQVKKMTRSLMDIEDAQGKLKTIAKLLKHVKKRHRLKPGAVVNSHLADWWHGLLEILNELDPDVFAKQPLIDSHLTPTPKAGRLDLSSEYLRDRCGPEFVDALRSAYAELDAKVAKGPYELVAGPEEFDCDFTMVKGPNGFLWQCNEPEDAKQLHSLLNSKDREIGELVEGLEFYADESNWADDWEINGTYNGIIPTDCDRKGGKRARTLIAKHKETKSKPADLKDSNPMA